MAKVTYRANVSILFEIEEDQAPEDLVSGALSENLQRNGVITDWHYIDGVLPQEVARTEPAWIAEHPDTANEAYEAWLDSLGSPFD